MKEDVKGQFKNRLSRLEGQIKAVQRMIEDDSTEPKKILMQFSAIISSLENAKIALVEEYTRDKILASLDAISDMMR